jgi:hypothetical protein
MGFTFRDAAAYLGATIFAVIFLGMVFVIPIRIFGFASIVAAIAIVGVLYFSLWGFVVVADKHSKRTRHLPRVF